MSSSSKSFTIYSILILALAGCSRQAPSPVNSRLVIQEFENQGPDPAQNWMGSLIAYASAQRLVQDPRLAVSVVHDAEGWRELGAGRLISGTIRPAGQDFLIEARLTDTATSNILSSFTAKVPESGLLQVSAQMLGRMLDAKLTEIPADLGAWRAFMQAQSQKTLDPFLALQQRFPGFAPAYPVIIDQLLRAGRTEEAQAMAAKLPSDADPLTKAQTSLLLAPDATAKVAAAKKLLPLRPSDLRLRAEIAATAANLGDWPTAVEEYQELSRQEPNKPDWWNSLGYAYANQGQVPEAVKAMEQYRRLAPNEANPIDSLGEIYYMNRNFKEAAHSFQQAAQRFPNFQNGVEWRKAAFANFYGGDVKAADLLFDTWLKQVFANAPSHAQFFQRAVWLARTGRWPQAQALLQTESKKSTGDLKAALDLYLEILRFGVDGVRPSPATLQALSAQIRDPNLRTEFSIFALLSQPAPNEAALAARIQAAMPQPQLVKLRTEMLAAAHRLFTPVDPTKPKIFPLPTGIDTAFHAMLLRFEIPVIR
ncbi:tetratricopeptide repeat protein [Bryobacter aggregatus]|uniref:tetratricopeptide repeat protein n=1 Tax=Bryobacter aggregatus TaxID=360054 RepID=UPI0004E16678|nr:tetratricopeptide repeat protein [Bryobacter aggregatus]